MGLCRPLQEEEEEEEGGRVSLVFCLILCMACVDCLFLFVLYGVCRSLLQVLLIICACVYVCIYVQVLQICVYVCVHTHTYTHTHTHTGPAFSRFDSDISSTVNVSATRESSLLLSVLPTRYIHGVLGPTVNPCIHCIGADYQSTSAPRVSHRCFWLCLLQDMYSVTAM